MRLFVALRTNLDKKAMFTIQKLLIRRFSMVKWVEEKNLHLTLKFLGEVQQEKLDVINETLSDISHSFEPFSFSYKGIGGFPNGKNARVIFVSVVDTGRIVNLMVKLDKNLQKIGFKKQRSYVPHLTLGRVKGHGVNLESIKDLHFNKIDVRADGILLMKSILTPQGPIYEEVLLFGFA